MYRNKPVKGFKSPLVGSSTSTNRAETTDDKASSLPKTPNKATKKPARSSSQILNFFEKAIVENDINRDILRNDAPKKRNADDSINETRATVAPGTKM